MKWGPSLSPHTHPGFILKRLLKTLMYFKLCTVLMKCFLFNFFGQSYKMVDRSKNSSDISFKFSTINHLGFREARIQYVGDLVCCSLWLLFTFCKDLRGGWKWEGKHKVERCLHGCVCPKCGICVHMLKNRVGLFYLRSCILEKLGWNIWRRLQYSSSSLYAFLLSVISENITWTIPEINNS